MYWGFALLDHSLLLPVIGRDVSTREGGETKFYTGRLLPEVPSFAILYTIFDRKGAPISYLLLANGNPFTYLVYYFSLFLTALKAMYLKYD